jgi:hypothetical protein
MPPAAAQQIPTDRAVTPDSGVANIYCVTSEEDTRYQPSSLKGSIASPLHPSKITHSEQSVSDSDECPFKCGYS